VSITKHIRYTYSAGASQIKQQTNSYHFSAICACILTNPLNFAIKTHGSELRPYKVESARRNIMMRPLHVSILQEGTLWKFRRPSFTLSF